MKKLMFWLAVVIVLLSFRFWMVKNIEFTNTEHLIVYRSWSISKFQLDEYGRHLPFYFGTTEGIQLPALTYFTTPFTKLFGSNVNSEIFLDQLFFVLLILTTLAFGYGIPFTFLMTVNPIFFWPGNWEAKLLTICLLGIWKTVTSVKSNFPLLLGLSLFSLSVSFDAWFTIPLILFIGFFYKRHKYQCGGVRSLGIATFCIVVITTTMLLNKNILNNFKSNYFNFYENVSIINTINSFRGQDIKSGLGLEGKLLHNKLQYIPILIGQSISYLNPSFLFATGDKNTSSNSMWVPPLLSLYLFLLIWSLISKQNKENRYLFVWILTIIFLMGFKIFPQTEQRIYLIAIPLTLLISKQINRIPKRFLNLTYILIVANLIFLGILSGSSYSIYQQRCPIKLFNKITEIANKNVNNKIFISDDVCSNLGPGIAMILSNKPNIPDDKNIYARYLTSIRNVEVVSGSDSNIISLRDNTDETTNSDVWILSKKLADLFPNEKEIIFSGDNENFSMYLIKNK